MQHAAPHPPRLGAYGTCGCLHARRSTVLNDPKESVAMARLGISKRGIFTADQIRKAATSKFWVRKNGGLNKEDILRVLQCTLGDELLELCAPKAVTSVTLRKILVLYLNECLEMTATDKPWKDDMEPIRQESYNHLPTPQQTREDDTEAMKYAHRCLDLAKRRAHMKAQHERQTWLKRGFTADDWEKHNREKQSRA